MRTENMKTIEFLSLICHFAGLFSVFIGMVVAFMDVLNNDFRHVQVGIYIFATGYALVKISAKLSEILLTEKYDENKSMLEKRG